MPEDRRGELRRLEDIRDLLRFCRKYGQSVPTKVAVRLREIGVADPDQRPIEDLLRELADLERPALESLETDRRSRQRRWLSEAVVEEEEAW